MTETIKPESWTAEQRIAFLEAELLKATERLDKLDPQLKSSPTPDLDQMLKRALERMNGDPAKATALFLAWTEQDSETRKSLEPLIREAIERRLNLVRITLSPAE